jgi:hypothetical protein
MKLPTTARAFVEFMERVWEGGPLYAKYENAHRTIFECGARRTGGTKTQASGDEYWNVWRFPGEDHMGVAVDPKGSGCYLTHQRYGRKK